MHTLDGLHIVCVGQGVNPVGDTIIAYFSRLVKHDMQLFPTFFSSPYTHIWECDWHDGDGGSASGKAAMGGGLPYPMGEEGYSHAPPLPHRGRGPGGFGRACALAPL